MQLQEVKTQLQEAVAECVVMLPEAASLRHLLLQVPLLPLFPRHTLVVGRQAEDGP